MHAQSYAVIAVATRDRPQGLTLAARVAVAAGKSLTVVEVAYPLAPVSADAVGGAEQIVAALDHALVAAGARSIVIASADSEVAGTLIKIPAVRAPITHDAWRTAHDAVRAAIAEVIAREQVDVLHLHGVDFASYLPPPGPPVLVTLHLPPEWYSRDALAPARPRTYLHAVSASQRRRFPPEVTLDPEIENGVDLATLTPLAVADAGPAAEDYAVVLGRICAEKAPHLALDAATRARVPLVVAGKAFGFPAHEAYFEDEVLPRVRPPHRFVGPVRGAAKARLLAGARCVVVPSLVDETSSLVAMEALACGTPVVGFRRGALPELVDDGVTGWLVEPGDVDALALAIAEARVLDRARCRATAEARCSRARMCARYLARYHELAAAAPPDRAPAPPRAGARPSPALRVERLDRTRLHALDGAWAELWARCPDATAFQHPGWCLAWCDHLASGEPVALAAWRGGTLAGVLPMFRWRDGDADVISMIGAGVSDYQDAVIAPGADDVAPALIDALAALRWDRLELSELRDGSPLADLALPGRDERIAQPPCAALPVAPGAPLDAVPPPVRRDIAYQRRRAERELGLATIALPAAELVDALARLHAARWTARGEPGVLDDARRRFLADALARLAVHGAVLGIGIQLGAALAAVVVGLVDHGGVRYYLGGFDPAHARRSPGTLAIVALIEEAGRRGARWLDFLRGGEPYKYRLGARDHVWLRRRVVRRT